jgi:hypothetical protein
VAAQLPANVNLSTLLALAPLAAPTGGEPIESVQSGTSGAFTVNQIVAFAKANTTAPGLSVLGVGSTVAGPVAPITAAGADQVLIINHAGNGAVFGAVNLATSAAVTGVLGNINGGIGLNLAQAVPAGGTTTLGLVLSTASNFGIFVGSGAPTLAAATSSLYIRFDATTATSRLYINTNGLTTWASFTASA